MSELDASLRFGGERRNLPVLVPNFDIVSISMLFGGFDCGTVICAIQDYAIYEMAVLTKKVHPVL